MDAVTAELALTKTLRLQQIANGILRGENSTQRIACAKRSALSDLVETIYPRKMIIWSCWVETHSDIADVLTEQGIYFTSLTGSMKKSEQREALEDFENDSSVAALIANQALGIGFNATAASYMIYYAKSWNLEHDIQSEARCYRAGSEKHDSVTRIDIIVRDSIEEVIHEALANKLSTAETILRLKEHYGIARVPHASRASATSRGAA